MKRLLILLVCALSASLLLGGCQGSGRDKRAVEVIIEGGGEFPQFLVGRWKAENGRWEFVFEPDGTISSVVISLGRVRIKPGQVTTVPMRGGGKGVFKAGQWMVQYSPDDRELAVEVVVDYFHLDMGSRGLEGHRTDWFVGPVSEDWQIWEAEWFTFPKYIILKPEPVEFPLDPNNNPVGTLVFRKQRETN